jgi:delta 1-pyrroline-5-carboxylate dehydrogenase
VQLIEQIAVEKEVSVCRIRAFPPPRAIYGDARENSEGIDLSTNIAWPVPALPLSSTNAQGRRRSV